MSRVESKMSRVESKKSRVESKMSRVERKKSRVASFLSGFCSNLFFFNIGNGLRCTSIFWYFFIIILISI